jgi:hypothetical protein
VLGERHFRALDDLYARLVWIPDGELERLDEAAHEYRRIVGGPDPSQSTCGPVAETWDGSRWAIASIPLPAVLSSDSTLNLSRVSCGPPPTAPPS